MPIVVTQDEYIVIIPPSYEAKSATLKTADTYVDRDITIKTEPLKKGFVNFPGGNIESDAVVIQTDEDYIIEITGEKVFEPEFEAGFIESVNPVSISVTGSLHLDKTELQHELTTASMRPSGYAQYRHTATKGYNSEDLRHDLTVYQGDLIL